MTDKVFDKDTQPMSQNTDEDSENVAPTIADTTSWGLLFWAGGRDLDTERLQHGKELYTIGRGVVCDIIIQPGVTIVKIENLSRIQCGIKRISDITADYKIILEDYSSNGTFVNGVKIGKGNNKILGNGDEIAMTCPKGKIFTYFDTQYINPAFPSYINKKFVIVENLGKGTFGEVWLSVHKKSNKKFAIKSVRRQTNGRNDAMQQLRNESELLCSLEHPCIVKVEDSICKSKSMHLVLELMKGGDLQKRIKNQGQMEESTAKYYFIQLVLAVKYLHRKGIVHRDLKPENILMSSQNDTAILKISDFGLSKFVGEENVCKTYCGTPLYLAPEVGRDRFRKPYTSAVDVWSLGVILFILLSGYHPFNHNFLAADVIVKSDIHLKPSCWSKVSENGLALVMKMLEVDPQKRPTLEDILKDPWMNDDDVINRVNEIVFADSTVEKLPSLLSSAKENDAVSDEPQSKRRRVTK